MDIGTTGTRQMFVTLIKLCELIRYQKTKLFSFLSMMWLMIHKTGSLANFITSLTEKRFTRAAKLTIEGRM